MTNSLGLFIRTSIMPEEDFGRYLARIGRFATKGKLPRAWLWPSGLGPLADELQRFVGTRDSLREHNLIIPLVSRTMKQEHLEMLEQHVFERPTHGLMSLLGLSGPGAGWARMIPARCPQCIVADIAPCSLPFWRREHLVTGVLMCSRHNLPLHITCDCCANFAQSDEFAVNPAAHCGCGLRPLPEVSRLTDADMSSEVELARISARLLDSRYMPTFDHPRIGREVRRAATAHGIVREGVIQWKHALNFLRSNHHARLLQRVNVTTERTNGMRQILVGAKVLRHPLQCIALLMALHGTWSAVEHVFALPDAEEVPDSTVSNDVKSTWSKTQVHRRRWVEKHGPRWFQHYREMYRERRKANLEMTHVQLMRQMPYNARLFISRESLAASGEDVPLFGFGEKYYEKLDESMSQHVDAKALNLKRDGFPRRLTTSVLLRGHRMERAWWSIEDRMPLTRIALEEHVETLAEFRARHSFRVGRSSIAG